MLDSLYPRGRARLRSWLSRAACQSLDDRLDAQVVGAKAANLARLRRWGYAVPPGWIWRAGGDRDRLARQAWPSPEHPLIVRSSVTGEDSERASAAGQYDSIADAIDRKSLDRALERCLASYNAASAVAYRRDRGQAEGDALPSSPPMSLLVQRQIRGIISGVAFSRDPVEPDRDGVAIEVVCGGAAALVSGQVTPARYSAIVQADLSLEIPRLARRSPAQPLPQIDWLDAIAVNATGTIPDSFQPDLAPETLTEVLRSVAAIARQLEQRDRGTPQDIEWTYDGTRLWLLQARPITTLWPLWTRRIAAEVAPGAVQPLTWSISQPLTCGVWGEIFTIVLGDRAEGLDFGQTATLHGSHAYFNASLLGDIFLRMGLPPESLEFLLRDRPMSRPSLRAMLVNVPGLLRLVGQQLGLEAKFVGDDTEHFTPLLEELGRDPIDLDRPQHSPAQLLARADRILGMLRPATHYNILAPIGLAIRQKLSRSGDLDGGEMPEVQATRELQALANDLRSHIADSITDSIANTDEADTAPDDLRVWLAARSGGEALLARFDDWLDRYGYLSEVGTNIAVPTWRETPERLLQLWWQTAQLDRVSASRPEPSTESKSPSKSLRSFARVKGRTAAIYDRLLAELRWCFVAIERHWAIGHRLGQTVRSGDIFFLTLDEVCQYALTTSPDAEMLAERAELIDERRQRYERDRQRPSVPRLVYGEALPERQPRPTTAPESEILTGIGASRGRVCGRIAIVRELDAGLRVDRNTILVVPYTDAGWSPLLARAGGLISAVGGRLSHGAIVAREYGIPAVMDVADAFERLQPGQLVWVDGESGAIEPANLTEHPNEQSSPAT